MSSETPHVPSESDSDRESVDSLHSIQSPSASYAEFPEDGADYIDS